jgi:hypothetical protein
MCLLLPWPAAADRLALVEFIPVVELPVDPDDPCIPLPVVEPDVLAPCMVLVPLAAPWVLVAPVALFWVPASLVADVPVEGVLPVVESAAKAGAATSNPNAQTEANRRPLSMFYSLPMPLPKRSAPHGMHRQRRVSDYC